MKSSTRARTSSSQHGLLKVDELAVKSEHDRCGGFVQASQNSVGQWQQPLFMSMAVCDK